MSPPGHHAAISSGFMIILMEGPQAFQAGVGRRRVFFWKTDGSGKMGKSLVVRFYPFIVF
jgi:hypothetical protein